MSELSASTERSEPNLSRLREQVAAVWGEILATTELSGSDNFFFEGGHSVLAVEAATRFRELVGPHVPLDVLFEFPQFDDLVTELGRQLIAAHPHACEPGAPNHSDGPGSTRALTAAEERLWFVENLHPGSPVYSICALYRFAVALDPARLGSALRVLTARHQALRRGFTATGKVFALAAAEVPLRQVEAAGLDDAGLHGLLDEEAATPLDLARPPLARALLVRRSGGDLLMLTVHHIVCDWQSLGLLEKDLQAAYSGTGPGDAARCDGDHAEARAAGPDAAAILAYWRQALAGAPRRAGLPFDRPRPAVLGVAGGSQERRLDDELLAAVARFGEQERLSPFMAWLTGYFAALAVVTQDRDLVVAVPVSARSGHQAHEVGMFVDTLPLRVAIAPDTDARGLARLVRGALLDALAHQPVPLPTLVGDQHAGGDRSSIPLTPLALSWVDETGPAPTSPTEPSTSTGPTWAATRERWPTGTAKYEMLLSLTRSDAGVRAELEHHSDLISTRAADHLFEELIEAARTAMHHPDTPVFELPRGRAATVPERVHAWALRTPAVIAVQDGETSLTYAELDERAGRIAAGLANSGLRRGDIVAVPMDRGIDAVSTCLGILRAGCAYLPVATAEPPERIRRIVEGIAAAVVVRDDTAAAVLSGVLPVLWLPALMNAEHRGPPVGAPPTVTGADLAYVISTSGSTGQPKYVAVPHRAITRLVPDADYIAIGPDDRVAQLSTPAFDAATFEMWGALTSGARLVVIPRETVLAPQRLGVELATRGVTVAFVTTALLHQIADLAPDTFAPLRVLLFGGERHDPRRLARLLAARPPGRVVHVYGPTENTTFSTWHDLSAADLATGGVPIGGPISGTTAQVLDPAGRPIAIGEVGELHLGGAGLAHGYLGAPATTAAAFGPNPFGPAGGRLYRTGDQVRLLAGGEVEFVGRVDEQVKVRGYRVELGEIEQALRAAGGVGDVVVTTTPGHDGLRVIAYLTPVMDGQHAGVLTAAGLQAELTGRLPDYMRPQIVVLERMPVNANGKIDRSALPPAPSWADSPAGAGPADGSGRAEVDELSLRAAGLWREVLDIPAVGPGDSFFALGGQSLKAMRLLSRTDEEFGVELELTQLFDDPSFEGFVRRVRTPAVRGESAGSDA